MTEKIARLAKSVQEIQALAEELNEACDGYLLSPHEAVDRLRRAWVLAWNTEKLELNHEDDEAVKSAQTYDEVARILSERHPEADGERTRQLLGDVEPFARSFLCEKDWEGWLTIFGRVPKVDDAVKLVKEKFSKRPHLRIRGADTQYERSQGYRKIKELFARLGLGELPEIDYHASLEDFNDSIAPHGLKLFKNGKLSLDAQRYASLIDTLLYHLELETRVV